MVDLAVDIAGVRFPNPLIIGSSSITNAIQKVERLVEAGAGGIITKTISPDSLPGPARGFSTGRFRNSLAVSGDSRLTVEQGRALISQARERTNVPIIANVIGRSDDVDVWSTTCVALERAGAHMIELDLNGHPEGDCRLDVAATHAFYDTLSIGQDPAVTAKVVSAVREAVSVPVISKLTLRAPDQLAVARASAEAGAHVLSGVNTLHALADPSCGADGAPSLPGFQTQSLAAVCGPDLAILGTKWTALICKFVDLPYISGSGVTTAEDAIERLALGAHAVAICSTVYLNGPRIVTDMREALEGFLRAHRLDSFEGFRARAAERIVERGQAARTDVVARIHDRQLWADLADDVYQRCELECACITRDGHEVVFDEARCTGCALPYFHAPQAVHMIPAR